MKIQLAITICCCLFLVFPKRGLSQSEDRVYRKFTTIQMQRALEKQDPNVIKARQEIERFTDSVQAILAPIPRTLPLVFHIFNKNNGQKLVSEREVEAQIQALNRDFNNLDYAERHLADTREGFNQLVADMEISFCLAHLVDSRPAIHFVEGTQGKWPADNSLKEPQNGGIVPWYPDQVINVWVADLAEDISGFAQMPGGPSTTDGIVIDYRFFGTGPHTESFYQQGKTLTHLMGNYLNLYDLWGRGPSCSDDKVGDTPIHNSVNSGCPGYKHISICGKGEVEMTMNFMDNTDDPCMYMFTIGQKKRIHSLFQEEGGRPGLASGMYTTCDSEGLSRRSDSSPPQTSPSEEKVFVYPNPTENAFMLGVSALRSGDMQVKVFSSIGTTVFQQAFSVPKGIHEYKIKCQDWASGIYFIQTQRNGISETLQLTVN